MHSSCCMAHRLPCMQELLLLCSGGTKSRVSLPIWCSCRHLSATYIRGLNVGSMIHAQTESKRVDYCCSLRSKSWCHQRYWYWPGCWGNAYDRRELGLELFGGGVPRRLTTFCCTTRLCHIQTASGTFFFFRSPRDMMRRTDKYAHATVVACLLKSTYLGSRSSRFSRLTAVVTGFRSEYFCCSCIRPTARGTAAATLDLVAP